MKPKQSIPKELRYTVEQFNEEFPDNDSCLERVMEMRFPGGRAECPECKKVRKHHRVSGRTAYACDSCGHHMYPLAGTVFEKSTTALRTWFYAMYQMGSTRCGISAKQIQRETGVTYKTAWRMFRQIRSLLSETGMQLEGSTVEVDEMYYGGTRKGGSGRPMRGDKVKTAVIGMVERKGRVIARTIPDTTAKTLCGTVREYVLPKTTVFTDEYAAYNTVSAGRRYKHQRINHASKVYVSGDVHTNTIEGFWSLVKRGISGVYHSVGQKYLQSYLNEYSFRYNRRFSGNLIFYAILANVAAQASLKPSVPVAENRSV
jgi:transposase